ncbi:MAG TPA: RNA-binding protein [Verrucomicrobiae bacterium]|nr:RNA-binding protein [Verrucomicrobiae bacterium]
MNTKIYVGNLAFSVTESDLRDLFSKHGPVGEVAIVQDRATGQPRGFGFVTMTTAEGCKAAIAALNGTEFQGRALTVNEARPREERSGGGGSFGGGRGNRRY